MDVEFVQRNWKACFLKPLAVSESLDAASTAKIGYEIGREVEWLMRMPDPVEAVNLRLAKIDLLYEQSLQQGGLAVEAFDPYWNRRQAFFNFTLST